MKDPALAREFLHFRRPIGWIPKGWKSAQPESSRKIRTKFGGFAGSAAFMSPASGDAKTLKPALRKKALRDPLDSAMISLFTTSEVFYGARRGA